jgi:hypothetical protein
VEQLLTAAQHEFDLANQALAQRNLAAYQQHEDRGRAYVAQALTASGASRGTTPTTAKAGP